MAKPLSKLRIKIIEEIKANGGWVGSAESASLIDSKIYFYKNGFIAYGSIPTALKPLNQESRNTVTHYQYTMYWADKVVEETLSQPESVTPATKPVGLETLLSTWKAANEVVVEQEEKLATAKLIADNAHKAVQEALGSFGWGKPALTITNAEDLLPGDKIRCIGPSWQTVNQDEIRTVVYIREIDGRTAIYISSADYGFVFEFVERPQLV